MILLWHGHNPVRCCELLILQGAQTLHRWRCVCVCVCQKSGAHAFGSVRDTRDTHGGENVDTPIGQFLLIGNFRRRLARELLVAMPGAPSSVLVPSSDALCY